MPEFLKLPLFIRQVIRRPTQHFRFWLAEEVPLGKNRKDEVLPELLCQNEGLAPGKPEPPARYRL